MSLLSSILPSFSAPACSTATNASSTTSSESAPARRPAYRVDENAGGYTVSVHLPGVAKDGLTVTAEDGVVTVTGRRAWQKPEGWTVLHRESNDFNYSLSLAYADSVDAEKIAASLNDGVLSLTLPKAEARKPRTIAVS